LNTKVALRDNPPKTELNDPDGLLSSVLKVWEDKGHKLPDNENLYWAVKSEIPARQGLKSSSSVAIAALRALCDATDTELTNSDLVDLASEAHFDAEITLTGSKDDNWAVCEGGWKIVDPNLPANEGVLFRGEGPEPKDWDIVIVLRGERTSLPTLEDFAPHQQAFERALDALQNSNPIMAMTWNGRAMCGVLNDNTNRRLTNDAMVNGGRGSGISGSGNAIVIFSPSASKPTLERIVRWYESKELELIITKPILAEKEENTDESS
jgi:shikimate kinase